MRIIFLIFLSCCFTVYSYSQYSYYKDAIIVKSDYSKLVGYVEKISESSLSFGLKFKKSLADKDPLILSLKDIDKVIFLEDSSIFNKVQYIHYKDTAQIVEYRLAKELLKGYAELYKLQLPDNELNIVFERSNTFVYIVKIDTNYYVLEQKEILEGLNYKLNKKYIGVLSFILKDNEELKKQINNLKFDDKHIISLINKFNIEHPDVPHEVLIVKEKPIINHGLAISYAKLNNFKNIEGSGYEIGYTISIIFPEISEKLSTNIGLFIEQIYYTDINNKYSQTYLKIPLSATYHFNNNKFSPFIGIGFSPYILGTKPEIFLRAFGGITFYKKVYISFSIENKMRLDSERILFLNLGYRFGTKYRNLKK